MTRYTDPRYGGWRPARPARAVIVTACYLLMLAALALVVLGCGSTDVPRGTVPAPTVAGVGVLPAAVGPSIDAGASVDAQAVRLDPPTTVPTGATGLPYAPADLTGCDEMSWYRQQAGLPDAFDRIGYRESRCINDDAVHTACCWGYWQLHVRLHLTDPRVAPLYAACGVASADDVSSATPADRQRQACAAAALYSVVGLSAWALTA